MSSIITVSINTTTATTDGSSRSESSKSNSILENTKTTSSSSTTTVKENSNNTKNESLSGTVCSPSSERCFSSNLKDQQPEKQQKTVNSSSSIDTTSTTSTCTQQEQQQRLSPYRLMESFFISIAMAIWIPFTLYLFVFSYFLTFIHSIFKRFPLLYAALLMYLKQGCILSLNALRISVRSGIQVGRQAMDTWTNHIIPRISLAFHNVFSYSSRQSQQQQYRHDNQEPTNVSFTETSRKHRSSSSYSSSSGPNDGYSGYNSTLNSLYENLTSFESHYPVFFHETNSIFGYFSINATTTRTETSPSSIYSSPPFTPFRSRQTTSDSTSYAYSSHFITPQTQTSPHDSPTRPAHDSDDGLETRNSNPNVHASTITTTTSTSIHPMWNRHQEDPHHSLSCFDDKIDVSDGEETIVEPLD